VPNSKQWLCAAFAAGCFFSAAPAEARFGKSGGSHSSGSHSSGGSVSSGSHSSGGSSAWRPRVHSSGDGERGQVHDATPVGQDSNDPSPGNGGGSHDPGPRRVFITPGFVWFSSHTEAGYEHRGYPRRVMRELDEPTPSLMVRMGVEGNSLREGKALGFNLGLEERYLGIATRLTALMLEPDDGSEGLDHIQLAEAHVTFAPVAGRRGRLRLEAGVAGAHAPDATFIGPSLALSFERCLLGPLDVEGRFQWVPLPHLQLDGQAGLALHLGMLTLRGGWHGLLLDDRGKVDGVVHRDVLGGPFAGLGLNF
jgi:hypothetical protein